MSILSLLNRNKAETQEEKPEILDRVKSRISNMIGGFRERISNRILNTPVLGSLYKMIKSKKSADTSNQDAVTELPELIENVASTDQEETDETDSSEDLGSDLENSVSKLYSKPKSLQKVKDQKIRLDFIKASKKLSNRNLTIAPELDQEAKLRLEALRKDPSFSHDESLKDRGIAENIERVYLGSGISFAQNFENSDTHRKNMREFDNMGMAFELAYDQAKDDWFYKVVTLYSKGRTLDDKELPPAEHIDLDDNAKNINVFDAYSKALDEEITIRGLNISRNRLTHESIKEEHIKKFIANMKSEHNLVFHYEVFENRDTGKKVPYLLCEDPPICRRFELNSEGKASVKLVRFEDLITKDFLKLTGGEMSAEEMEAAANLTEKDAIEDQTPGFSGS